MINILPDEIIFEIMGFCDPKTLLNLTLVSNIFRKEVKNNYKRYFEIYRNIYPHIFEQINYNEIVFYNNCFLYYMKKIGFATFNINYINRKPSDKYYEIIKKMIKLKKLGISSYQCEAISKNFINIDKIIFLIKKGFPEEYAKLGIDLSEQEIENLIILKNGNFMNHYSFEAIKVFNNVEDLVYLKSHGFWDSYCIEIALKYDNFDDLINLKKIGFEDYYCIKIHHLLSDFNNVIKLKKAGFNDAYCLEASLYFQNVDNVLQLKKLGMRDYFCINYAKYIDNKDIEKIKNLKENGYSDVDCGRMLKIEMF